MTSRALDARISLATSVHAQPGVYALLIGSGTSTGTGMPTGYGVIQALVRQAAAASPHPLNDDDVETWWSRHGDGQDLGYSNLLEELAPTQAARSALLSEFFEASDDDRNDQRKVPGPAHKAIAELVRKGLIKVIVTTNFDRLLEQALSAAGVVPQVVDSEAAVRGMKPLVHSACTVIKVHGDYKSLEQRNTLAELSSYGEGMQRLIEQVLDEYGLVINGWSAEWDKALVQALKGRRSRRYPLFWTAYSTLGEAGAELAERHNAVVIDRVSADDFFPDLLSRLESLESLNATPLSEAMAVARLKKLLPYREKHIELRDFIETEIEKLTALVAARPQLHPSTESPGLNSESVQMDAECSRLLNASRTLIKLIVTGVMFDRDRLHTDLWVWVIEQLLRCRPQMSGPFHEYWVNLSHYPALLVFRASTIAAVAVKHEDVFLKLSREPVWKDYYDHSDALPAYIVLDNFRVLEFDRAKAFPRWNGNDWLYPLSMLIEDDLRDTLQPILGDQRTYREAFLRTEYRNGLLHLLFPIEWHEPTPGLYWSRDRGWSNEGSFIWEMDFRANADRKAWDWGDTQSGDYAFSTKLSELTESVKTGIRLR